MNKLTRRLLAFAALAASAFAAEPKRVIVCTVTAGFRHDSIPTAEKTLQKLADESKAFVIVDFAQQPTVQIVKKPNAPNRPGDLKADADDKAKATYEADTKKFAEETAKYEAVIAKWTPADDEKAKASQAEWDTQMKASMAKLSPENLAKVDGVIFANTTGNLPLPDREGFIKWIEAGHAFIGMHSATDTYPGFPAYTAMIGGNFDGHPWHEMVTVRSEDTKHPATGEWTQNFEIVDEIYQMKDYARADKRVILSLDPSNDQVRAKDGKGFFSRGKRADNDYAVAWIRKAGSGRVFYTSLGHRNEVWQDAKYQAHILGGIRWALGLAQGSTDTTPLK